MNACAVPYILECALLSHLGVNMLQITFDFVLQIPSNISVFRKAEVLQLNPCSILCNSQKRVLALQNK